MTVDQEALSLIPPARLGALLSARRRSAELDLAQLAARSKGRFDTRELELFEKGRAVLSDDLVGELAQLYELETGPVIPARAKLIIDLDRGKIKVGASSITTPDTDPDAVLERYLALTYTMRKISPGTPIPLRAADLEVLSRALGREQESIRVRLTELMDAPSVRDRALKLQKRLAVPGAGLLVGFTSVGAIVLAPGGAGANEPGGPSASAAATADDYQDAITEGTEWLDIGAALVVTNPQHTTTDLAAHATERSPEAALGAQAAKLIAYDYSSKLPGWKINFEKATDHYRGMTKRADKTITVFVRSDDTSESVAQILAHEVAHALDLEHLTDDDRVSWLNARDMPMVWWISDGLSDFEVGQGDFAEAIATVWVGESGHHDHSSFTPEQLKLAEDLLP